MLPGQRQAQERKECDLNYNYSKLPKLCKGRLAPSVGLAFRDGDLDISPNLERVGPRAGLLRSPLSKPKMVVLRSSCAVATKRTSEGPKRTTSRCQSVPAKTAKCFAPLWDGNPLVDSGRSIWQPGGSLAAFAARSVLAAAAGGPIHRLRNGQDR